MAKATISLRLPTLPCPLEFNSINTTATNVDSMIVLYLSTFKACPWDPTRLPPELCLKTNVFDWLLRPLLSC